MSRTLQWVVGISVVVVSLAIVLTLVVPWLSSWFGWGNGYGMMGPYGMMGGRYGTTGSSGMMGGSGMMDGGSDATRGSDMMTQPGPGAPSDESNDTHEQHHQPGGMM